MGQSPKITYPIYMHLANQADFVANRYLGQQVIHFLKKVFIFIDRNLDSG